MQMTPSPASEGCEVKLATPGCTRMGEDFENILLIINSCLVKQKTPRM